MRAAPERAYRVRDLVAIAGVSARSLQRQFRAGLGQTPIEVLRAIRLECARQSCCAARLTRRFPIWPAALVILISDDFRRNIALDMERRPRKRYGANRCSLNNGTKGNLYSPLAKIDRPSQLS
jgi:AraC-like DNA-binding protein